MVVAHCVRSPIYLEVVQMRIGPSEGCLQNVMQLSQRDVAVDPDAPSHGWFDIPQLRVKRIYSV